MNQHNLFVYGSLMSEDVLKLLLNRIPKLHDAKLKGFSRHALRHASYPAIVKNKDEETMGKMMEINDGELEIMDIFEGDEYTRELVNITLSNNATKKAFVYIGSQKLAKDISKERWDLKEWEEKHLASYLEDNKRWMKERFKNLDYVKYY